MTVDLGVLTPRQRLVVVLHCYDNWTSQEVADAIGITTRNVERCYSRALLRLYSDASPVNDTYKVDA